MPAVAADVPTIFDVIINGVGYLFDKRREDQALLGHTPTFVPRNNNSGFYGDNEQDFFLTVSQKDWSGGAEQRHWGAEAEQVNRFYASNKVEVIHEGEIRLGQKSFLQAMTQQMWAGCGRFSSLQHFLVGTTNAYLFHATGLFDLGAHGVSVPAQFGACTDGVYHYVSGGSGIRKVDSSGAWSAFSSTATGSIAYLNNQLYACDGKNLWVLSSSGVATSLYTWTDATGVPYNPELVKVIAYGSNLLIYFRRRSGNRPELWMYDGSDVFRVAQLPIGVGGDAVESNGIVFLSSAEMTTESISGITWPAGVVYVWVNGSIQEIWRDDQPGDGNNPAVAEQTIALGLYDGSVVFAGRNSTGRFLRRYILETGAVETIEPYTVKSSLTQSFFISSSLDGVVLSGEALDALAWPGRAGFNTSGTLDSSLYDFGSSLLKLFRSIRVDFDPTGGTVLAAYQVNKLDGAYISLGAVTPGVELPFPDGLTGNSISIRLTLNYSSGFGPVVRRVYVRAAPFHQSYRKAIYHLDLSGSAGKTPIMHRDGSPEPATGHDLANLLYTLVTGQTPVTVIDALGSYTGLIDPEGFQITQVNPREYVATVSVRQV